MGPWGTFLSLSVSVLSSAPAGEGAPQCSGRGAEDLYFGGLTDEAKYFVDYWDPAEVEKEEAEIFKNYLCPGILDRAKDLGQTAGKQWKVPEDTQVAMVVIGAAYMIARYELALGRIYLNQTLVAGTSAETAHLRRKAEDHTQAALALLSILLNPDKPAAYALPKTFVWPKGRQLLEVLQPLVQQAGSAPTYDDKHRDAAHHFLPVFDPPLRQGGGKYFKLAEAPFRMTESALQQLFVEGQIQRVNEASNKEAKKRRAAEINLAVFEKLRNERTKADSKRNGGIYPRDYPQREGGQEYYNYALGWDLMLAMGYGAKVLGDKNSRNADQAVFFAGKLILGQDPENPPGPDPAFGATQTSGRSVQNEKQARYENYFAALQLLFEVLVDTKDEKNIADACALYNYILDGQKPVFEGKYKETLKEVAEQLKKREAFLTGPYTRNAADKLRDQMASAQIKPAYEKMKAAENALKAAELCREEEKGKEVCLPYVQEAGVLIQEGEKLLDQVVGTKEEFDQKFPPIDRATAPRWQVLRNLNYLALLYVKWADELVENGQKPDQGQLEKARTLLEKFDNWGGADCLPDEEAGQKKKKKTVPEEARETRGFVGTVYLKWADRIIENKMEEKGQDPEPLLEKAIEILDQHGQAKDWQFVANTYIKWAEWDVKKHKSKANPQTQLDAARAWLDKVFKQGDKVGQEVRIKTLETLVFMASVYAQWADVAKDVKQREALVKKAEALLKEFEDRGGELNERTLGVFIGVATVYVHLSRFDKDKEIKAKEILSQIYEKGLSRGGNSGVGLRAVITLNWIFNENFKAVKKNENLDSKEKREGLRQEAFKSALLLYALLYGEKGKEGEGMVGWSDFDALAAANPDLELGSVYGKDPYLATYVQYARRNSSDLLDAGRRIDEDAEQRNFTLAGLKYGRDEVVFRLASAMETLAKKASGEEAEKFKGFAILLYQQVVAGEKRTVKDKIVQDAIWALANLTKEQVWFTRLETEVLPAAKEMDEPDTAERYLGMLTTVASGYLRFGVEAQKKGELEKAKGLFDQALAFYNQALTDPLVQEELTPAAQLKIYLGQAEVLKLARRYDEAAALLARGTTAALEAAGREKEDRPLLLAQFRALRYQARVLEQEIKILRVKEQFYLGEIDLSLAQASLEQARELLTDAARDMSADKDLWKTEEGAAAVVILLRVLSAVYGNKGGLKIKTLEGGAGNFKKAAFLNALLFPGNPPLDWVAAADLEKGDPLFSLAVALLRQAVNKEEDFWDRLEEMEWGENDFHLTSAELLKAAAEEELFLYRQTGLFGAEDKPAEKQFNAAINGAEIAALPALTAEEQDVQLKARLGLIEIQLLTAQELLLAGYYEEAQKKADAALNEARAIRDTAQKCPVVYMVTRLRIYRTLAWACGVRGGVEEKVNEKGEGSGQVYFNEGLKIFEEHLVEVSAGKLELKDRPYLNDFFLQEAEIPKAQILFDYLELKRAALKQDQETLAVDPGQEEAVINQMLDHYAKVAAACQRPEEKEAAELAALEFHWFAAKHYKNAGKEEGIKQWSFYLEKAISDLGKRVDRNDKKGRPKTRQEAALRLKARLLLGWILAERAGYYDLIFGGTPEEFKEAEKIFDDIFKAEKELAPYLAKLGVSPAGIRLSYIQCLLGAGKVAEAEKEAEKVLAPLQQKKQEGTPLSPAEHQLLIELSVTLGDFFVWKKENGEKAEKHYAAALAELGEEGKKDPLMKKTVVKIYRGQAWAAYKRCGDGRAVKWCGEKDYQGAKQGFEALIALFSDHSPKDAGERYAYAFAYYGLAELGYREAKEVNWEAVEANYNTALKILGQNEEIEILRLKRDVHTALAEMREDKKEFQQADEERQKAKEEGRKIDRYIEEQRKKLKSLPAELPDAVRREEIEGGALKAQTGRILDAPQVEAGYSYTNNTNQGNETTSHWATAAASARVKNTPQDEVRLEIKAGGGAQYGEIGIKKEEEKKKIDAKIKNLEAELEDPEKREEGCDQACVDTQKTRLQQRRERIENSNPALLKPGAELEAEIAVDWQHRFARWGEMALRPFMKVYWNHNSVVNTQSGKADPGNFVSGALGADLRFAFTGFRPLWDRVAIQFYGILGGQLAAGTDDSGLAQMQRTTADNTIESLDNQIDQRDQLEKKGKLPEDQPTREELEGEREIIRTRKKRLNRSTGVIPDGGVGGGGSITLLSRASRRFWGMRADDLTVYTEVIFSKNTWDRTNRLFYPSKVRDDLYFVDPDATGVQELDPYGIISSTGLSTRLYLGRWGILVLDFNFSTDLQMETSQSYSFTGGEQIIFPRLIPGVKLFCGHSFVYSFLEDPTDRENTFYQHNFSCGFPIP